ncbi:MAG TPA: biopolymer transporter ExbD [Steroidobacteraceae bacterium]|nr:biopolymer transporter ExbD [Steroidobacteraceae bacterium]
MFPAINEPLQDPGPTLNTTPLIDVMLVLLTMLMLTLPAMTHSIRLDLARGQNLPIDRPPVAAVDIEIGGSIYWNGELTPLARVEERTRSLLAISDRAEFHVRPARFVRYEYVAKMLAAAQRSGARRISFVGNERYL